MLTFFSGCRGGGDSAEDWEVFVRILGTPTLDPPLASYDRGSLRKEFQCSLGQTFVLELL